MDWHLRTAVFVAAFGIAGDVVSYAVAPRFGRFADTVDRRIVLIVYGFITFMPTFVYWFFPDTTPKSLWATHIASIFAAIGRSSNVAFALSAEVTNFEDRALAAGLFYGLTNLLTLLLSVLPAIIIQFGNPLGVRNWYDAHPRSILYYQAALVAAFALSAMTVAKPRKRGAEDDCQGDDSNADSADDARSCECVRDWVWLDMVKLLRTDERIRRLSTSAFFLSVAGTISVGNDGQFFAKSLGLYRRDVSLQFDKMAVLRALGAHIMVLPGYLLAGYCAMKSGTLKVLRWLVPVTAVLVASGGLLKMIGHMWFVPVVVAVQTMGDLYQVPLMRMAFGVARPGRTGTWLSLVGMAVEAGSTVGNLVIIAMNSTLLPDDWGYLWAYYPAAGLVALLGLLPLLGKPKLAIGWGAAAGSCKEQFAAMMAARKLGRRWRNKTAKTPAAQTDPPASIVGSGATAPSQTDHEESSVDTSAQAPCDSSGADITSSHSSTALCGHESSGAATMQL